MRKQAEQVKEKCEYVSKQVSSFIFYYLVLSSTESVISAFS